MTAAAVINRFLCLDNGIFRPRIHSLCLWGGGGCKDRAWNIVVAALARNRPGFIPLPVFAESNIRWEHSSDPGQTREIADIEAPKLLATLNIHKSVISLRGEVARKVRALRCILRMHALHIAGLKGTEVSKSRCAESSLQGESIAWFPLRQRRGEISANTPRERLFVYIVYGNFAPR